MFKIRSTRPELIDGLEFDIDALMQNLDEFEAINRFLGTNYALKTGLEKTYKRLKKHYNVSHIKQIRIADLGCGAGDLSRVIYRWALQKNISLDLNGIDINAEIVQQAKLRSSQYPLIGYQEHDIFSSEFQERDFDIICLNNICHHFNNDVLISLFKSLSKQAKLAVIINDLHRNFLPYYSIIAISKIFNFSYLARHDGPLSVLKAFRCNELKSLLTTAGIKNFEIEWKWPFRWQVIIWCNTEG